MPKENAAPPPGTITADQLCEYTGLTDRRHRQLAAEGYFPAPVDGRYLASKALSGVIRYYRDQLHKKEDSLADERKRYTRARREKLEVERDILRNLYVKRDEIGPLLRNLALNQRAVLQNKLENELSLKLAGLDPIQIRQRMAEAVDELCRIFLQATIQWTQPPK